MILVALESGVQRFDASEALICLRLLHFLHGEIVGPAGSGLCTGVDHKFNWMYASGWRKLTVGCGTHRHRQAGRAGTKR